MTACYTRLFNRSQMMTTQFIVVSLCTVLILTGCGISPEKTKNDPKTVTLEFWTLQMLSFKPYMEDLIQRYEASHRGVRIHWVDVPFSEGEKKALTALLSDNTPDVINLNPDFSALLASRGALLNLNTLMTKQEKSSYLSVAWQAASIGDEIFGVPWYLTSAVTLFNTKLIPKPPKNDTELAAMAQALAQSKKGALLMPTLGEGGRFFRVLKKAGIPLWDSQGKLCFADHGADQILQFWVRLYKKQWIPPESLTEGQQAAIDRYQSGTLGMLFTGPNFLNIVRENAPEVFKHTQVGMQYPEQSAYMDFSEMILVIPTHSQHPKAALDFALFVTNPQNTIALSQLAPVLPPHKATLLQLAHGQNPPSDLLEKARRLSAQQLLQAKTAMPVHPMQNRLNQLMDYAVQQAFLGRLTPQQAMRQAQQKMNDLLQ